MLDLKKGNYKPGNAITRKGKARKNPDIFVNLEQQCINVRVKVNLKNS